MTNVADALSEVQRTLGDVVRGVHLPAAFSRAGDAVVLAALADAAHIMRQAESVMIAAVVELENRVDAAPHPDRPTTRHGCRSMNELVQRSTLASARRVGELLRAARAVREPVTLHGQRLPAAYPVMREAVASGAIGVEATVAVVSALDSALCDRDLRADAEHELAASARGAGVDGGPPPNADELRLQAQVWALYLDQDGAEPREARALRKRGLTLGACRDGVVPIRAHALPEVAAQLQRLFDSILNPKGEGPGLPSGPRFAEGADATEDSGAPTECDADQRTRAMKQHDALAMILSVAARSGELPTIGGAVPTLVVAVDSENLTSGAGSAHIDGYAEPIPLAVARQVACSGAIQRVTSDGAGRIVEIGVSDRVFAAHQRRAIVLRDGGCVIPGCSVPAAWCEIHHVREHADGGATHTDNGVLLCWYHHRTIDSSGWAVRMTSGVPEVRGPRWWDGAARWRAVTTSPTRLGSRLRRRRAEAVP